MELMFNDRWVRVNSSFEIEFTRYKKKPNIERCIPDGWRYIPARPVYTIFVPVKPNSCSTLSVFRRFLFTHYLWFSTIYLLDFGFWVLSLAAASLGITRILSGSCFEPCVLVYVLLFTKMIICISGFLVGVP